MSKPDKKTLPLAPATRLPADYGKLLGEIKSRIRSAQYEAFKAVNREY